MVPTAIRPVVTPPDVPALLLLSSGTTGLAKLVPLTWGRLWERRILRDAYFPLQGPVVCLMLPSAAGGVQTCLSALWHGTNVDLSDTMDTLTAKAADGATRHIVGSPAQMSALLGQMKTRPAAPGSLSGILLMGGAVSRALSDAAQRMFGCPVTSLYGTTELGACATQICGRDGGEAMTMNLLPGIEAEVIHGTGQLLTDGKTGGIRFRSPCQPDHYWCNSGAGTRNFRDGWFHPGDVGSMSGRRIRISGRLDDVLNFGGIKINPAEIDLRLENALLSCDAAAFKFTGDDGIETLVIAAVAETDVDYALAKSAIMAALGTTGYPVGFFRVAVIPRNAMRKPLRGRLAAAMAQALSGSRTGQVTASGGDETDLRQPVA